MKEYIVHAPDNHVLDVKDFKTFFGEPIESLIRCEDCIHWAYQPTSYWSHEVLHFEYPWCHLFKGNEYCAKGERREE